MLQCGQQAPVAVLCVQVRGQGSLTSALEAQRFIQGDARPHSRKNAGHGPFPDGWWDSAADIALGQTLKQGVKLTGGRRRYFVQRSLERCVASWLKHLVQKLNNYLP